MERDSYVISRLEVFLLFIGFGVEVAVFASILDCTNLLWLCKLSLKLLNVMWKYIFV